MQSHIGWLVLVWKALGFIDICHAMTTSLILHVGVGGGGEWLF